MLDGNKAKLTKDEIKEEEAEGFILTGDWASLSPSKEGQIPGIYTVKLCLLRSD